MRFTLLIAALCSAGTLAYGQGLEVKTTGGNLRLSNPGKATLIALKVGKAEIQRLEPGQAIDIKAPADIGVHGRFALADWHLALDDLDAAWAPYHLRTAGFLLDAIAPGGAGTPDDAANLKALQAVSTQVLQGWPGAQPLRQALVARAARFAPPELVVLLMSQSAPDDPSPGHWPPAYQGLESVQDSLRSAIERHGAHPRILDGLQAHPAWAQDRGFAYPALLRFTRPPTPQASAREPAQVDALTRDLAAALEAGRQQDAARYAVDAAYLIAAGATLDKTLTRMACGGLDIGAHQAIRAGLWLSTQAYLTLAGRMCGDRLMYRSRVAEFLRRRGDEAVEALDLGQALDWFRGALWFGSERQDRARLADTHAELAILNFRTGHPVRGAEHLESANTFGALRPRVVAATELKPTADPRARFGLIIIILFVAFFAIRRLVRLFGDRRDRPQLD